MNQPEVFLLGVGHGAVPALRSLQGAFQSVQIVSTDASVVALKRESDVVSSDPTALTAPLGVMAGHQGLIGAQQLAERTYLNVHYALLPRYRGMHPVIWAILNEERTIGLTVHVAVPEVDAGAILHQHAVTYSNQTSWELMREFNAHIGLVLGRVVREYADGDLRPRPQDERLATWVPKRDRADCVIDFTWRVGRIAALFRALVEPYPLPAVVVRGRRFEVTAARVVERPYFATPGRVVNLDSEGVWVKCQDGLLVIRRLRSEEADEVDASSVLSRGARLQAL